MITAVDSNVLLDVFTADPKFGEASREALRSCGRQGSLVACDVVWAEVSAAFSRSQPARAAMARLEIGYGSISEDAAVSAGAARRAYRARGGRRTRVIADFLVGAHALHEADRLLTRDRGFYRSYFGRLSVLDPS